MANIIRPTEETFDTEVLEKSKEMLVIVDFSADWCGPCQAMAPIFKKVAEEYTGKAAFAKVDTDANPTIATKYGIMSIPNFKFFKNREVVDELRGAVPETTLKEKIDANL